MTSSEDLQRLHRDLGETEERLAEAEATLHAIRHGEVDGLLVAGPHGDRVFTLSDALEPYRRIVEQMSEGTVTLTRDGLILYANPTFARMLGLPRESIVGTEFQTFLDPRQRSYHAALLERAWQGSTQGEVTIHPAEGPPIPLRLGMTLLDLGETTLVCVIATDLTERKNAENYREMGREVLQVLNEQGTLHESVQRVLTTLKRLTGLDAVGIRLQDGEDFPYFVQEGFSREFLLTENSLIERGLNGGLCRGKDGKVCLECTCGLVISGKTNPAHALFTAGGSAWTNDSFPILDLPPDEDPRLHPRNVCIHQGYASIALVPIRTQDRIVGLIQLNDRRKGCFTLETVELLEGIAAHIGLALVRKQAEEENLKIQAQLQQSQKMESLGILAGGVAHDMNNVLGAILGLASAHIGTQPYGSPLHQALDTICKATERGGKMVKSLLSFARQSPAENNKLDMNAIVREQISLMERTTLAKVRLETDLEAELRPILGDASALTHAFMNLCVNAVDAMPENGTLTLHTRNVDIDWIEVVVEDNGMGMPKEVLDKAMEPFFTTKETGKGTGLGLSMVFSTVKAHRGHMSMKSEPGKGTRVMLRFPACEQESPVQPAALALAESTQATQGSMKVLLVDDDDLIQVSVRMILDVLGHTVVNTAPSGEEALAMLEAGFEPDLVILDMNMPGLGGIGTLPRLRVLRPEVPVLLATGRVDQTALSLASAHPGVTLLAKPFGLRELQKHLESLGLG